MLQFSLLQPDLMLGDTVVALTPTVLQARRLQGLILDVDETLVPIRGQEVPADVRQWVEITRARMPLWLISNNLNRDRIAAIGDSLGLPYAAAAQKPSRRKLREALTAMDLPSERVAMVGDRLFTDVLAGNRLGMYTILVEPIVGAIPDPKRPAIHSSALRTIRLGS
ncbi:MAG: YqeG family HAD IIIA-type phosphatase, partial [Cyanobacteria bacterium J06641_5]